MGLLLVCLILALNLNSDVNFTYTSAEFLCCCDKISDNQMFMMQNIILAPVLTDVWYAKYTSVCIQCIMCDGTTIIT